MRILIVGGTRFIGPHVVRQLHRDGHELGIFHRGKTAAELPDEVRRFHGDRRHLADHRDGFARFGPRVVLDMFPYTETDATLLGNTFRGLAERLVALSSCDVYRAYGRLAGLEKGPPGPLPLAEDAPLREAFYLRRCAATSPDDWQHHYEKIVVERTLARDTELPATVLRLPFVYGPGDYRHRLFAYLKRMDDGREAIPMQGDMARWRSTRGYVENVAAAIALTVVDDRARGRIYNVGEEDACSEEEWAAHIGRAVGWQGRLIRYDPEEVPEEMRQPLGWEHHMVLDTGRLRRELGFVEPVRAGEALARTIAWERENPPTDIDPRQFDYEGEDTLLAGLRSAS